MGMKASFYSPYSHGFVRACVCIPKLRVADPDYNTAQTLGLARQASELGAAVALFPELGLSAYSNEDLFHQDALLEATLAALGRLVEDSRDLSPIFFVGAPLRFDGDAVQLRHRRVPRPYLRQRPQILPAQLSRVLRGASVHARPKCPQPRSDFARSARPLRQ